MLDIDAIASFVETDIQGNSLKLGDIASEDLPNFIQQVAEIIPDHYISPESIADTLDRLGKHAAAEKLRVKLPEAKKLRSGDVGEILATDYVEESTVYSVPVLKLRWRDHQNMPMRGDDVIGFFDRGSNQSLRYLKVEAKSSQTLGRAIMGEARNELDSYDGKPSPHALTFIAERLREIGNEDLSNKIELAQYKDGIRANQVEHLLFTLTGSNPKNMHNEALTQYSDGYSQKAVGLRARDHKQLIEGVFDEVANKNDA